MTRLSRAKSVAADVDEPVVLVTPHFRGKPPDVVPSEPIKLSLASRLKYNADAEGNSWYMVGDVPGEPAFWEIRENTTVRVP